MAEDRKEYIERANLQKSFCEWCNKEYENEPCEPDDCPLRTMILEAPKADVVEVTRCKDCQKSTEDIMIDGYFYCNKNGMTCAPDHYCGYGERKNEDA